MASLFVCLHIGHLLYSKISSVFLECRKALFLYRLSRTEEAIEAALDSIDGFPWNWSTWTLLVACVENKEQVSIFVWSPFDIWL